MSHLYVPSGKYPSYAPVIFMLVLFITTGICGFIYGYYSTEFVMLTNRNTPGINPIASLIGIGLIGASHIVVIFLLIKKLKIRNPSLARRWAWCASAAGWSLNWLMGLYIASGSDFGLFHLIANRLANGVPGVVMLYQSSFGPPIFFWINGYILLLIMVFEALAIPLLLGLTTRGFASLAFSEKKEDWYKLPVELPFRIYKHPKSRKMILKGLETDYDWVEDSKLNLHYNMLGYPVTLFFPDYPQDNIYCSLYCLTLWFNWIPVAPPNTIWLVTVEQVEMLIKKFDPNKITRATELLDKYRHNNKLGKVVN